jgi:cell division protein FtsB
MMNRLNLNSQVVTMGLIVILAIISLVPQVQIWYEQQVQIADLEKQNAETRASLAQMKEDLKRWDDPAYVRAQARDRLYYVMPGEISFLVMGAENVDASDETGTVQAALAASRNSSQLSSKVSSTKSNWTKNLIDTVIRAGVVQPEQPDAAK